MDCSVNVPHAFRVGLFLEAIIRRQGKAVELLGNLCGDVLTDWMLVEDSIHSTNLRLVGIEAEFVYHFLEL